MEETPAPADHNPLGGIALEVAVQLALTLGHRQLVVRLGEVIHADELITTTGQEGDGVLQHGQFSCGAGMSASFSLC